MHTACALRILVALTLVFAAAPAVQAAGPAAELTTQLDRLVGILKDPALQEEAQREGRRLAVRRVVEDVFDFDETARRALGRHWDERSAGEGAAFVRLFTALIDRAYLSRLDDFEGERIVVVGDHVDGSRAVVRLHVVNGGPAPLPVDLHLRRSDGR